MRSLTLLVFGVHLAYAARHSLQYFYTGVSGVHTFPEFTAVGMVDGEQHMYFDSYTKLAVAKTEWIRRSESADYWNSETQVDNGYAELFKNNIQVVMERFNQSTGVHTFQRMYGCEWNDETGETNGFNAFGYDGEDFLALDLKERRFISPVQKASLTLKRWNKDEKLIENDRQYFGDECIKSLKKYVDNAMKTTVSPQVSLLQKDSSSPVLCHVTGFYPSGVEISWMKNGQDSYEDVDYGELVPNEDGTFQKTSTLRTDGSRTSTAVWWNTRAKPSTQF